MESIHECHLLLETYEHPTPNSAQTFWAQPWSRRVSTYLTCPGSEFANLNELIPFPCIVLR